MLIRLKAGEIINLYNVAYLSIDEEGTIGIRYHLTTNKTFTEEFDTKEELDARIEELMNYNIGLAVPEYNDAIETAKEIGG